MATISEQRKTTWLQILCIICGVIGMPGIMITHVTPHRSDAIFTTKNVVTILSLLCLITFFWVSFRLLRHFSKPGQKVKSLVSSYLFVITGSYTILVLFVLLFQDTFIARNSVIFQPKTISPETAASFVSDDVQALEFITPDRVHLSGWLVKNNPRDRSPLILYFGGSSQEVSNMIPYFQDVEGWSTALVNYRGYGLSEGSPSEENFFQDAALIYDVLSKREDVDPARIVPMGWSLGTGVAVYLSEQRPVRGTILVTPFDHWAHMFQSRDFPLVPLRLIKDKYFVFNSIKRAPLIQSPVLCLVGAKDKIVHPGLSKDLIGRWGGEETTIVYPDGNHGLLFQESSSWKDIAEFLEKLP